MSDPSRHPDTGVGSGRGSATGAPRWVKASVIIAAVLILLVVIVMFVGGGGHGPARHAPSGDAGGQAQASNVTESGVRQS